MTMLLQRSVVGTTPCNNNYKSVIVISKSTASNNDNSSNVNLSNQFYCFLHQRIGLMRGYRIWYIYILATVVTLITLSSYYYNSRNLLTTFETKERYYNHGFDYIETYLLEESSSNVFHNNKKQTQRQLPTTTNKVNVKGYDFPSDTRKKHSVVSQVNDGSIPKLFWHPRIIRLEACYRSKCSVSNDPIIDEFSTSNNNSKRNDNSIVHRSVTLMGNQTCTYCQIEADSYIFPYERPFYEECIPMKEWQTKQYLTCNSLHEIHIPDDDYDTIWNVSLLSMEGSWRSVWKVQENYQANDNQSYFVMKLLQHNHREFNHESYSYHRIDAIAMEQLTSSPYVVNIYGFCGQSVITEAATGSARNHVKNTSLTALERLRMGRDVARALSDVHTIDCHENSKWSSSSATSKQPTKCYPTLAHNDMNMANVIEVNDTIKLNDFNIAVLLRWNDTSKRPCSGTPVRFASLMWKSPEEILNTSYIDPAKADVYGLGNLLFQILTRRQPWTHMEPDGPLDKVIVAKRKLNMSIPHVKPKYSTELDDINRPLSPLYYAVLSCFRYHPNDRPTATELAVKLDIAYHYFVNDNNNMISHVLRRNGLSVNTKRQIIHMESQKFQRLFELSSSTTTSISNFLQYPSNDTISL